MLLVVDDEPLVRQAIVRAFQRALPRAQAHAAGTVRDAIALIEQGMPFQGAIIDIQLGKHSGFEIVQHIRDKGSSLPVLMLTGFDDQHKQRRAQLLGATYLPKPIHPDNLLAFWRHAGPQRYRQVIEHTARAARLASREAELFGLLATGTPRSAVAEVMTLAPSTIRSMCSRVRCKLGGGRIDNVISAMKRQWEHDDFADDREVPLGTRQS